MMVILSSDSTNRKLSRRLIVEGDFDAVGNEAFRRLFNYISGKNTKSSRSR